MKRDQRSTILRISPGDTSDTILNLDLLEEAKLIERYTTDLIQELQPTVGSTLRKSWDKYSTDPMVCSYHQGGMEELPFTLVHYLLFLQYELQQIWSKTGEHANVAAKIECYSYRSAKDVLRDPPFGPWVERFYELVDMSTIG